MSLSDFAWIKRFSTNFPGIDFFKGSSLSNLETASIKSGIGSDYQKYYLYRKEIDEVIINMIESLDGDKFGMTIQFKNHKGDPVDGIVWKVLLQMFNHQTHHRGMISAFIDQLGVQNDYSSMMGKI